MGNAKYLLGPMRPPFLLLAPVCVVVGIGAALHTSGRVNPLEVALVLLGAVSAHISVNAFNEYCDFRSGLDTRPRRTPFRGGRNILLCKLRMMRLIHCCKHTIIHRLATLNMSQS